VALIAASSPAFADASAECKMEKAADQAGALLQRADFAKSKNDFRSAAEFLAQGLAELHDYYLATPTPPMLDDSGMHLVLADSADQRGDSKLAAMIRRSVLVDRLGLFKQFHHQSC